MNSNQSKNSAIFSLRIVSVDNYMKSPLFGLDTCYSEFRADEIKQVPVIRIFGTDANGIKTCAHIHGVFPYLYVPFAGNDATGESNRLAYQMASSLDKAINISLGQANSSAQHVFKIILVKAMPFYGYHQTEHKFLKIFLYNPAFIRRAANLLQNGAILGRVYQPHESHVPFNLQFMIDYNLYGMSFLYVPSKLVRYRKQTRSANDEFSINGDIELDNDDILNEIDQNQFLDRKIDRMSASKQEIDVTAAVILNRFQISMNEEDSEHANPGIAFLWSDERGRRSKMEGTPPPLVVTQEETQDRGLLTPVESELFHLAALNRRLEQIRSESPSTQSSDSFQLLDQTLNRSNANRKFDLNQFLQNSVYPSEWTSNDTKNSRERCILNASFQIDHLQSSKSRSYYNSNETTTAKNQEWDSVQFDPNDTIVDEELILNLTQKTSNLLSQTFNENEHEVLDIFELLEEEDQPNHDQTLHIDDDSALAPLSQQQNEQILVSQQKDNANYNQTSFEEQDSDDDLLNEFSMSILECLPDENLDKIENFDNEPKTNLKIPQFDGASDSPKKGSGFKKAAIKPNLRSPSRNAKKYTPLNIVISKSPSVQNGHDFRTSSTPHDRIPLKIPKLCLEKCDANIPKTVSSISSESEFEHVTEPEIELKRKITSKQQTSVEHNQQPLKEDDGNVSSVDNNEIPEKYRNLLQKTPFIKLIRYQNIEEKFMTKKSTPPSNMRIYDENSNDAKGRSTDDFQNEKTPRRNPQRNRRPCVRYQSGNTDGSSNEKPKPKKLSKQEEDELNKMDFWYSYYKWSDCEMAEKYDRERKFFPEPGPSNLNYYADIDISGYYRPVPKTEPKTKTAQNSPITKNNSNINASLLRRSCRKANAQEVNTEIKPNSHISNGTTDLFLLDEDSDLETDVLMQSIYEESFAQNNTLKSQNSFDDDFVNSPSGQNNSAQNCINETPTLSTPILSKLMENLKNASSDMKATPNQSNTDLYTIKPSIRAPHRNVVNDALNSNEFPKVANPVPFYSDPNDLSAENSKKEIGHTVLQLTGNGINDCEEFESKLQIHGLSKWHQTIGLYDSKNSKTSKIIRKKIARNKILQIKPNAEPPSYKNTKKWLELRANRSKMEKRSLTPDVIIDLEEYEDQATDAAASNKKIETKENISKISNGQTSDLINSLRSKKELTVSLVSTRNKIAQLKSNTAKRSDNDDAIIFEDDNLTIESQNNRSLDRLSNSQVDKNLENSDFQTHLNLEDTIAKLQNSMDTSFGIKGGPLENSFGFRLNLENFQCAKSNIEHNFLTILSLEIHCQNRAALLPDPVHDEIICIFYEIFNDVPIDNALGQQCSGVFINIAKYPDVAHLRMATQTNVTIVMTEIDLFVELVRLIRKWDPDIFAGYEIELASWGYVIQRSQAINFDLVPLISRIPSQKVAKIKQNDDENPQHEEFMGFEYDSEYKLHGRILLDVWRLLRGEIALTSYSFENIMYHVMHRRCPLYSIEKLTQLWNESVNRWIVIDYYLNRVKGTLEILNQLDLVGRTCELAKLFGIQFYEVLSRGSQFRVESMMLRIAKPKNLIPISPSVQQRAHMRAPEYLPLILEPHSRFYSDPLIVLDFQSLYPSMIIAYNYCFSTCLGRVEHLGQSQPFELGAWQLRVPRRLVEKLIRQNMINISPAGAVFVKSGIREGVLPRMLQEILDTRLMVKQSMKLHKNDKLLQRILHSRQLGLKLMANVTYGYTAANFSGRMPCVEVGDSVVSKGRETLERAIRTVEMNKEWGCRVIYGDTDSMFVLVPGRSREEAFRIGNEIADTVTSQNPFPVRLKLEKVYQPSILQTKKRYVGYMYETAEQTDPVYEAKGIETVRRDGCPAVAKVLEKTLRILFETCDVSAVKRYICKQFTKILSGRANVQDLIFAKEFRGVNGYKPGACVPSLELTRAALQIDRRAEPRRGERVPYLVINGPPGVPLIRLVRSPHEYLTNEALKINAMYYITKVLIPPLNRCLLLIGADANQWYSDLPRKSQYMLSLDVASTILTKSWDLSDKSLTRGVAGVTGAAAKKSTISQYFSSTNCVCDCGEHTQHGICSKCLEPHHAQQSVLILTDKCMQLERKLNLCLKMCSTCCGQLVDNKCMSLDCSVLFMLNRWKRDSRQIHFYRQLLSKHF